METQKYSERIGIKAGLLTALALIAYFVIMRIAGLAHLVELRAFNFFILFAGVAWSIKYHARSSSGHYNYFATLGNGCLAALTASVAFAVFLMVYLYADPAMMQVLRQKAMFGAYLDPVTAATGVFAEGMSSGMVIAYISLSYINNRYAQITP